MGILLNFSEIQITILVSKATRVINSSRFSLNVVTKKTFAFVFSVRWNRSPIVAFISSHIVDYPTPVNLNYMWSFGSTAGLCLVIQIVTGIFLAMHYTPHVDLAFSSVEHIMRDVNNGWLIRYIHANGASMFFVVVYCHIFRGLYYGSYMYPRGLLWASGVLIFLLMMATAFMGYVLPWGQMSFWGATVITNLFSAIPLIGFSIVEWLWGGFSVDNATLNRFFSLHYLMPFLIAGLTLVHLSLLHKEGSNNPLGINTAIDTVSFYPYFYVKDLFSFLILVFIFALFLFFYPNALGHADNYTPANPLVTPPHIVPEWYFLPFYAILRSVPDKLGGVAAMISAILVLFLLPIINTSEIRSSKFRPIFRCIYWFLVSDFIILGWIGQKPVESPFIEVGMCATIFYFLFMLVLVPSIGILEKHVIEMKNLDIDLRSRWGIHKHDYKNHTWVRSNKYPWFPFMKGEREGLYNIEYKAMLPLFNFGPEDPRASKKTQYKINGTPVSVNFPDGHPDDITAINDHARFIHRAYFYSDELVDPKLFEQPVPAMLATILAFLLWITFKLAKLALRLFYFYY